ncbi:hypothetical protein D3C77_610640 [compost metagenome]
MLLRRVLFRRSDKEKKLTQQPQAAKDGDNEAPPAKHVSLSEEARAESRNPKERHRRENGCDLATSSSQAGRRRGKISAVLAKRPLPLPGIAPSGLVAQRETELAIERSRNRLRAIVLPRIELKG